MSHYAKVLDGKVVQVIVAEADFFNTFVDTTPGTIFKLLITLEKVSIMDKTAILMAELHCVEIMLE